jgi:hypothetical protein
MKLSDAELAELAVRHQEAVYEVSLTGRAERERVRTGECTDDDQPWPCDAARLLAHLGVSVLDEAVRG